MPDLNPAPVIVAKVLQRLAERPFEPFVLVRSNRSRREVATPDPCTVQHFSRRINVDHDDGSFVTINALHLAPIELLPKPAA
jgi:hypothetical protein